MTTWLTKLRETAAAASASGGWVYKGPGYRGDTVSGYMDPCATVIVSDDEDDEYEINDLEPPEARHIARFDPETAKFICDVLTEAERLVNESSFFYVSLRKALATLKAHVEKES